MANLQKQKEQLYKQLKAIELLEKLDPEERAVIKEVLCGETDSAEAQRTEECPHCHKYFLPSGIKRHITVAHGAQ